MADSRLISADSHFVEPPTMWVERLDRRFRDRAPRAVKLEGKPGEYFVCEDIAPAPLAAFFSAGVPAAEMPEFMKRGFAEAPKGVHDPAERIKDHKTAITWRRKSFTPRFKREGASVERTAVPIPESHGGNAICLGVVVSFSRYCTLPKVRLLIAQKVNDDV